jgi:hypothetical protein
MRVFAERGPWLFSRRLDLLAFAGSALASWLLVALGAGLGIVDSDAPDWSWLACVVAIDVAHVWSTGFRVYFAAAELRERPLLYLGLPVLAYLAGVALHALSALSFWRALAYVAVFHFVRQQAGFMALYARRALPEPTRERVLDRVLDQAAIYAVTLYPILHWHAHLPRRFAWFVAGDFVPWLTRGTLPALLPSAEGLMFVVLGAFALRQLSLWRSRRIVPGKSLLVTATFACWYGGIVLFDSDYVFMVTNVLLHGVPYLVLTYRYARASGRPSLARAIVLRGLSPFLLVCIGLALTEEALWDRLVWHERAHLFGTRAEAPASVLLFLVPLLAVPQLTHYFLDGFVWRVRSENPVLRRELEEA